MVEAGPQDAGTYSSRSLRLVPSFAVESFLWLGGCSGFGLGEDISLVSIPKSL